MILPFQTRKIMFSTINGLWDIVMACVNLAANCLLITATIVVISSILGDYLELLLPKTLQSKILTILKHWSLADKVKRLILCEWKLLFLWYKPSPFACRASTINLYEEWFDRNYLMNWRYGIYRSHEIVIIFSRWCLYFFYLFVFPLLFLLLWVYESCSFENIVFRFCFVLWIITLLLFQSFAFPLYFLLLFLLFFCFYLIFLSFLFDYFQFLLRGIQILPFKLFIEQ